ncbi:MAG: GntR family transcriptional regulator [Proteobacteria bacterium]|nr:GntR family transcriptional regulator [Pseudomonadota bacterium]
MSLSAFADLQRAPTLAEQIYQRLRYQLRSGTFAPGERLVESNLAQQLIVSRSPVREALSRLAAEGLLESRGSGFQVVLPTAQDMAEIFEMRRLLEPPAARQVARAVTPELVDNLAAVLERARIAERAADFAAFAEANYAFRTAWLARVPSRRLRDTVLRFDDQAGFVRRTTLVLAPARADALALLQRFTVSFRAGDEDAAAAVTAEFVDVAARYYREVAQDAH